MINSLRYLIDGEMMFGLEDICLVRRKPEARVLKPDLKAESAGGGDLASLKKEVLACAACQLARTRTNVVFGEGDPHASLMFIGEAPGQDEDMQARPFVGRAGQLLTKIIEAMGLARRDVYIGNILKCRPPGNRNPLPSEILSCGRYLARQIEIIRPKVICALGKFAAQTLLKTEVPISELRGKFFDYHGIKLMPTYHPAYLLRNPDGKKDVWNDMKKVAEEIGLRIQERKKK